MKRVLVTGGAGFLGSHIVDMLVARRDQVLVLDNFATGKERNLPPRKDLHVESGSVADEATLDKCFRLFRPERVIHAAASYKDPNNWEEDIRTNALGSALVAEKCADYGVGRLIYFQTALCYGLNPIEQPITLSHPLRPEGSSYAYSKTVGEQYIRLSGVNCVVLRLANAYGPRNLSGPLPTFYKLLSEGKPCIVVDTRRDFVYGPKVAELAVLTMDGFGSGAYHVSTGRDYAIKDLYEAVCSAMGISAPVSVRPRKPDDAPTILLDPSRTQKDFAICGWKINYPLSVGVENAVEFYKHTAAMETYTHLKMEE